MTYYEELKSWATKVVGMSYNKACDLINDDGHNCCVVSDDGKEYNPFGSLGDTYVYITVEKNKVIKAETIK